MVSKLKSVVGVGGRGERLRFSMEDDINLLREVIVFNPFENSSRWEFVRSNLVKITKKNYSSRAVKDHMDYLIKLYIKQDWYKLKKSGSDQQYSEKERLLLEASRLWTEFKKPKTLKKGGTEQVRRTLDSSDSSSIFPSLENFTYLISEPDDYYDEEENSTSDYQTPCVEVNMEPVEEKVQTVLPPPTPTSLHPPPSLPPPTSLPPPAPLPPPPRRPSSLPPSPPPVKPQMRNHTPEKIRITILPTQIHETVNSSSLIEDHVPNENPPVEDHRQNEANSFSAETTREDRKKLKNDMVDFLQKRHEQEIKFKQKLLELEKQRVTLEEQKHKLEVAKFNIEKKEREARLEMEIQERKHSISVSQQQQDFIKFLMDNLNFPKKETSQAQSDQ